MAQNYGVSCYYFYPRSPCGERPDTRLSTSSGVNISIHALLAESDSLNASLFIIKLVFLSTLSLRRATSCATFSSSNPPIISIHALLAESDCSDRAVKYQLIQHHFYPRSPCGERPTRCARLAPLPHFYPRSPCGERRLFFFIFLLAFVFLSTLSLRRATLTSWCCRRAWIFLSTLSLRRATRHWQTGHRRTRHFYPRSPCGERLSATWPFSGMLAFLSTLSLRRATAHSTINTPTYPFLSTLSLRRATVPSGPLFFHSQHFYPRSPCGERPFRAGRL